MAKTKGTRKKSYKRKSSGMGKINHLNHVIPLLLILLIVVVVYLFIGDRTFIMPEIPRPQLIHGLIVVLIFNIFISHPIIKVSALIIALAILII